MPNPLERLLAEPPLTSDPKGALEKLLAEPPLTSDPKGALEAVAGRQSMDSQAISPTKKTRGEIEQVVSPEAEKPSEATKSPKKPPLPPKVQIARKIAQALRADPDLEAAMENIAMIYQLYRNALRINDVSFMQFLGFDPENEKRRLMAVFGHFDRRFANESSMQNFAQTKSFGDFLIEIMGLTPNTNIADKLKPLKERIQRLKELMTIAPAYRTQIIATLKDCMGRRNTANAQKKAAGKHKIESRPPQERDSQTIEQMLAELQQ